MPAQALLIDLDGVIRQWPESDAPIEAAHGLPAGAIRKVAFSPELLGPAVTGATSDEAWRRGVATQLNLLYGISNAIRAVDQWSAQQGEVDQSAVEVLKRCYPSVQVVLVTNATSRLAGDLKLLGIAGLFHSVVNSSEVKVAKPDPAVFRIALQRASVEPSQALFVDDSAANVEAAASIGIHSHRFVGASGMARFLDQMKVLRETAL